MEIERSLARSSVRLQAQLPSPNMVSESLRLLRHTDLELVQRGIAGQSVESNHIRLATCIHQWRFDVDTINGLYLVECKIGTMPCRKQDRYMRAVSIVPVAWCCLDIVEGEIWPTMDS
jgi:hypothetical protein